MINSANFYSGSHTNPTLKVTYDGTTESSAVAVDSTDWQRLTVTITPTTTAGKINVSFEGEIATKLYNNIYQFN